jgi:hypothetical protein
MSDPDWSGDEVLRHLGPQQVRVAVDGAVSFLWGVLPAEKKSVPAVEAEARALMAEAVAWWRAADKSDVGGAAVDASQGLQLSPADGPNPEFVRYMLRQAASSTWLLLPVARRSDDEVERVLHSILDRCVAALREDASLFELPAV